MNPAIIHALFLNIIIPEVAGWLANRRNAGDPLPTKEEILARMNERAETFIAAGEAFLASKGAL